jgi:hypothetical protein
MVVKSSSGGGALTSHRAGHPAASSHSSSGSIHPSPQKHHSGLEFAVELGEEAHKAADGIHTFLEYGNKAFQYWNGTRAFRRYSWIMNKPVRNAAGNFRGMVVSKKWRTAYDVTIENAEKLEKFGNYLFLAGVAVDIAKKHEKIGHVLHSNMATSEKVQRLTAMGSMAIFNAVGAPIPGVTHLVAGKLAQACHLAGAPQSWSTNIQAVDIAVRTSYDTLMDSDNVVHYVNTHLVLNDRWIEKAVSVKEQLFGGPRAPTLHPIQRHGRP